MVRGSIVSLENMLSDFTNYILSVGFPRKDFIGVYPLYNNDIMSIVDQKCVSFRGKKSDYYTYTCCCC